MKQILPLPAICEVICAHQEQPGEIPCVVTDSRAIQPGCLFVALHGEKFDGHAFVAEALAKGAAYAVVDVPGNWPDDRILRVGNTESALRRIASLYRDRLDTKLVAITGSVGKTSTREMVAAVLAANYHTTATKANLNNQVGVPGTLLGLESNCEAAVIEMGMSGFGEIEKLTLCARPDVAIVTNIGVAHMELLGSRENIFRAKMEIVEGMRRGSPLILNGDDDLLGSYRNASLELIRYGMRRSDCEVSAEELSPQGEGTGFSIQWMGRSYPARIPALGRHNVMNALAGFAAGVMLGIPPEKAAAALANYSPTGMRQKMVACRGFTVVEDCYNASPDSFAAALHTLAERPCDGRRILVAADMLELGAIAVRGHYGVGELAGRLGVDAVWAYGDLARHLVTGARDGGAAEACHFSTKQELADYAATQARPGDTLWVKGSRSMQLEDVLAAIYSGNHSAKK